MSDDDADMMSVDDPNVDPTTASTVAGSSSPSWVPALGVLVFVHGFKGDESTFGDYPARLEHNLRTSFGGRTAMHSWVYPAFETRGELSQCVERFGEWLTTRVAELEMETAAQSPTGKKELARVVLIGHSMGGIVVADFARSVAAGHSAAKESNMWPRIVGILAYDTPYLGVHPAVFKNAAVEGWGYVQQAQAVASAAGVGWSFLQSQRGQPAETEKTNASANASTSSKGKGKQKAANQDESTMTETLSKAGKAAQSSAAAEANSGSWLKYGYGAAGAAALAAAAGTAWYSRQQIVATASNSQLWVTSHLEFVGVLWKTDLLRERMEEIMDLSDRNVQFHCFHTLINPDKRTFIYLPNQNNLPGNYINAGKYFSPNLNTKAKTEIEAHCAMFDSAYDAVYSLGSESCILLKRWLETDGKER